MQSKRLGLYIHIPFCKSKCDYCDFYSLSGQERRMDDYQAALMAHLRETAPQAQNHQVDTLYIGGGTPSFYGAKRLCALLKLVRKCFSLAKDAEITVECNPDSADLALFRALRRAGVNRISLGMQSACDSELRSLNRPHTMQQVRDAVAAARRAKLTNVSLDLIFGLPEQTQEGWAQTVEEALRLKPEHLSCYGLTLEEGTPLARRVAEGLSVPDGDAQADLYLWTVERLAQAGYQQYEISNFAREGYESRHNLRYWLGQEYAGFGAAAHSDFGGCRYAFVRDLDAYIRGITEGGTLLAECERVPLAERSGEYLMLRLRTTQGIEEWEYRRTYFMNFDPLERKLQEYAQHGWAVRVGDRWRLTPEGFLLSNQLIGTLLELQEHAQLADTLERLGEMSQPTQTEPHGGTQ